MKNQRPLLIPGTSRGWGGRGAQTEGGESAPALGCPRPGSSPGPPGPQPSTRLRRASKPQAPLLARRQPGPACVCAGPTGLVYPPQACAGLLRRRTEDKGQDQGRDAPSGLAGDGLGGGGRLRLGAGLRLGAAPGPAPRPAGGRAHRRRFRSPHAQLGGLVRQPPPPGSRMPRNTGSPQRPPSSWAGRATFGG